MRASAAESSVKRCSGTRSNDRSARTQYANEVPSVKNFFSAVIEILGRLRKERAAISAPVLQLHRPFTTHRSSRPPAPRRIFKSLGAVARNNARLRSQFSL